MQTKPKLIAIFITLLNPRYLDKCRDLQLIYHDTLKKKEKLSVICLKCYNSYYV